ncbi:hypothetical protein [Vibrio campbellii]|uniref:hypothetical protein n=1 Tax=Vibrio campbellii TaxID=680 RepID=UPI000CD347DF|nr:hypothetical protein [Vibrio campbellii]AUW07636.1 hypothetical protein C1N51_28880 [Vibrio campbellii]
MDAKTVRITGMGVIAFAMMGWMGYDFLSQPSTPPMSSDVPSELFAEPVDSSTQDVAMLAADEAITPQPDEATKPKQEVVDVAITTSIGATTSLVDTEEKRPTIESPPSMVTFTLSHKAQAVLDALEETYLSQVTDAKLTAQIAAQQRQDTLTQLTQNDIVVDTPVIEPTLATIDRLTVKSIVSTPNRITAWVELNGQTVPIQRGAWINDVRALNITKDFVRFVNKQGKEFTKYVDTALPIVSEKDDGKLR